MTPEIAAWITIAGFVFTAITIGAILKVYLSNINKAISELPNAISKNEKRITKLEIWVKLLYDEQDRVPPEIKEQ